MTEETLRTALEALVPPTDARGLETCLIATPAQFRVSFSLGATNILGALSLAKFRETFTEDDQQTWEAYVCAVDEASFHAGMALAFVRQLLEIGKQSIPIQPSEPWLVASPTVTLEGWTIDYDVNDGRRSEVVARGFQLAQQSAFLGKELECISDWLSFSRWAIEFLRCCSGLVMLATEVCSYQWSVPT